MVQGWKVLIADDEPNIREGIRDCVDWERLGLKVAAEAEDGEEALELALEHDVRILLVDLNMPIMNGLTLIGLIRERLPACKVIIITGHDEFTYAQEAIRLGVDDYILKPVSPQQLFAILEKAVKQLEIAAKNEEHLLMASKQIERNFSLLRERFCLEWMDGELSEGEILEQLSFLKMPVSTPVQIGVIRWPSASRGKELLSEKDRQLYLFAMENMVEEILSPYTLVKFRDHMGMLVVLLWHTVPDPVLHSIDEAILTYLKITAVSAFLPVTSGVETVASAYLQAKTEVYKETRLSPFVRSAKDLISKQFSDPDLNLEGVANDLRVSSVYLSRIFKQETGISFISMLTQIRIKHAIHLLTSTDLPMLEIAEHVGYDSQHYFSTAFKKIVGLPPNQYRKEGVGS
ncbi:response regulator transcription factor [Paenibacillus sedimenti]|uniref:Response regulator n=1 Tax=Paenibacillus sedimenti TaxID=2770274 RepID=A0A926QH13_9BACL|nr:response regulator [Paenibacillus sedimenti]MBD0379031.1 response regulator [Paenibacillus sedimenti]